MEEDLENKAWRRGWWEMVKEALTQKLRTWHLPKPPLLVPNQLSGLIVIITGATSGIGLHAARELVVAGAHVIMACRNIDSANRIICQWREETNGRTLRNVEAMQLDLLSLSSVHRFAEEWRKRETRLHMLINNAGALYMKDPQKFTVDGIEQHMQVNHVAPALLTLLLLPSLLKAPNSRIVNVNSVAHHWATIDPSRWISKVDDDKYVYKKAYGESKLAQLMFLKTLAAKLSAKRITSIQCIAVHPGIINTKMVKQEAGISEWMLFWMLNPVEGARSVLFCATSASIAENLVEGFACYSCTCQPVKEAPQAMDVDACLNVWQKTLEILHLNVDYFANIINY